jgi:hypothetical protein
VSLVGFDLFPVHFPAHENLLNNNPAEHIEQYDVVHVRVFPIVVNNKEPGPLVRNVIKILKPGGYIQWEEFDGTFWKAVAPGDDAQSSFVSTAATTKMLQTALESSRRAMNLEYAWIGNLGSIFSGARVGSR